MAQAFIGDELDNKALPCIKINVIMVRHAGFLTDASVLGRATTDNGPHLVYVPEVAFSIEKFLSDVEAVYKRLGRCVIAVSEGITLADGTPVAVKLAETQGTAVERDAHGNVQLSGSGALADALAAEIKSKLKIKRVRADTFGYLQRSFAAKRRFRGGCGRSPRLGHLGGANGPGRPAPDRLDHHQPRARQGLQARVRPR